jgi:NAD(P)H-dependent FMN reductase
MEQSEPGTIQQATHSRELKVGIVVGSTRPGRKADAVASWVHDLAVRRDDATFEVVDIADYALPHLDEPIPPLAGQYSRPHTHKWAAKIESFDAYVFVTPEYNHSTSGALKNAIDFLFAEWNDKAAGFVSYGVDGGVRAVEHLRLVMGELKVADVRSAVALSVFDDFEDDTRFRSGIFQEQSLSAMLDELVAWGRALRTLRDSHHDTDLETTL